MSHRVVVWLAAAALTGLWSWVGAPRPVAASEPEASAAQPDSLSYDAARELIGRYCLDCHAGDNAEAGLDLDHFADLASIKKAPDQWQKVRQMIDFGAMPPGDADQPEDDVRRALVRWIDEAVLTPDCSQPGDPGRVTLRRLNRFEYNCTVRDLFGLTNYAGAEEFPSDEVGGGFDNNADVLTISPLLFEKYLAAAEDVAGRVIRLPNWERTRSLDVERDEFELTGAVSRDGDRIVFVGEGEAGLEFEVPEEGRYELAVRAGADQAGPELARMAVLVDGNLVTELSIASRDDDWHEYYVPAWLAGGKHRLAVRFVNDYWDPQAADEDDRDRNLWLGGLKVWGPLSFGRSTPEQGRQLLATAYPRDGSTLAESVHEAVAQLLRRAFRRPARAEEVEQYAGLVTKSLERGVTIEQGLRTMVTAVLSSPAFLFRAEEDPRWEGATPPLQLNDHHIATRLSYFLWSSMPDEELMAAADAGRLRDPDERRRQVMRMLADEKAEALVEGFAHQWLNLRMIDEISPDPAQFPIFTDALRRDMLRETDMFFLEVMREDKSILDFIGGRYTYLNERLAKVYGLEGIEGEEFRRVSLDDTPRSGVLTHPSVLLITSNPTRTSLVKRGKWVMENILGTPPPDPPPNTPTLEESASKAEGLSLREQLALHRASPICASCHVQMDAIGLAMENFDPLGQWRDKDGEHAIEPVGELPSGERFEGPVELAELLEKRSRQFATTLTRRMLAFALGRSVSYNDQCVVEEIVQRLEKNDYRFSELVLGIVESQPFLYRSAAEGEGE